MTASFAFMGGLVGLFLAGWMATSARILQEYSRRELELYCQKRRQLNRFNEILDEDEQVLLAVECLQALGTVFFLFCVSRWLLGNSGWSSQNWLLPIGGTISATVLLLAVTSWLPWSIVRLWAAPFLFHTWWYLKLMTIFVRPLSSGSFLVDAVMRRLANRPETEDDDEEAFEDEIRSIVTEGFHEGLLEEDAREMIEGVIELGDTDVSDIMTPRSNVDAMDFNMSWQTMMSFVVEVGRTRIPVYEKSLDSIVGVLYVKDLLRELSRDSNEPRTELKDLIRKPLFVPLTKPLNEMLQEFQQTRDHLAIVVDEYRSVAGVVTIEDVLEEIVGEIRDESDKDIDDDIRHVDEHTVEILGTAHIADINSRLRLDLPEPEDCDTLAGLLIRQLGRIPKPGESWSVDGVQMTVTDASRRKIDLVRVEMPAGDSVALKKRAV